MFTALMNGVQYQNGVSLVMLKLYITQQGIVFLSFNINIRTNKVHQRIVDPRLNFEMFCDWLKIGHVV
jgi:hypothetical protein